MNHLEYFSAKCTVQGIRRADLSPFLLKNTYCNVQCTLIKTNKNNKI